MKKIAIIGGGHAGVEAALIANQNGVKTSLFTLSKKMIANMPCNPSIGGPAKGTVVREIDALGGEMGRCADQNNIQVKLLNSSKGPGVWALRAQADKVEYPQHMIKTLEDRGVEIIEELVTELIIKDNKVTGLKTKDNSYDFDAVVITTGTYMSSQILVGKTNISEGPDNQITDSQLSNQLKELGFRIQRLKTGTPPRVDIDTVDFSKTEKQPGDLIPHTFSFDNKYYGDINKQWDCYLTYTNKETQKIIEENIALSAMYNGEKRGTGPRYCPSIEDKIVRFSDKDRHQIFLEPESKHMNTIYVQGLSMSFPTEIQDQIIRTVPGLENSKVLKYAYAIEYDAIDSTQLKATLESKLIDNLFFGGQVNGTSGYEEAAAQGLVAGANAMLKVIDHEQLILERENSYIGVMIDDLVTKGTNEPYRLLTSRAENRIILRNDNADERLNEIAYNHKLISKEMFEKRKGYIDDILSLIESMKEEKYTIKSDLIIHLGIDISQSQSMYDLIKRTDIDYKELNQSNKYDSELFERAVIYIKLEGYVEKAKRVVNKLHKVENVVLSKDLDYSEIQNLALEAQDKLNKIKPETLGQASRISGINPSDITNILIYLKKK